MKYAGSVAIGERPFSVSCLFHPPLGDDHGRPDFPLHVDSANPIYESDPDNEHVDYAARYSHFFGHWDVGVSYFRGRAANRVFSPTSP